VSLLSQTLRYDCPCNLQLGEANHNDAEHPITHNLPVWAIIVWRDTPIRVSRQSQGAVFVFWSEFFSIFLKKSEILLLVLVTYFPKSVKLYMGRANCAHFANFIGKKVTL